MYARPCVSRSSNILSRRAPHEITLPPTGREKSSIDDFVSGRGIVSVRVGLSYDPLRFSPRPSICSIFSLSVTNEEKTTNTGQSHLPRKQVRFDSYPPFYIYIHPHLLSLDPASASCRCGHGEAGGDEVFSNWTTGHVQIFNVCTPFGGSAHITDRLVPPQSADLPESNSRGGGLGGLVRFWLGPVVAKI